MRVPFSYLDRQFEDIDAFHAEITGTLILHGGYGLDIVAVV